MKWIIDYLLLAWLLMVIQPSAQDFVTISPLSFGPQGEPEYHGSPENPPLKPIIRSLHITSDIKYRYARTLVFSRVVNPANRAGQAAFSVILPENAFISNFYMEIDGKLYKSHVKEHEEANKDYEDAVAAGQSAGHVGLESRDSRKFTTSVNIVARGEVNFFLMYEQLLQRHLGLYSHVINIDPQQFVMDMSVSVKIEEPSEITHLEVPELQNNDALTDSQQQNSLAVIEEKSPNNKKVTWAPTLDQQKELSDSAISGQFIVRYDVDRKNNSQQILISDGYFVHFFAPDNLPVLSKHAVFVLDFSGSMLGQKLRQLKDAMKEIVSDLRPKDYFSLVVFQSYIEVWSPTKIYSTGLEYLSYWELTTELKSREKTLDHTFIIGASDENIKLALSYLENYSDFGGTNIMGGLRTALELVNIGSDHWINESDPPQPVIMFLTDGQPNTEESDTDTIVRKTIQLNTHQNPMYCLAFGYDADFNFMRKLCLSNHGFARVIYEAADARAQLEGFFETISSPSLANVTFSYLPDKVDISSNTKNDFRVTFNGSEIVVAGKLNSSGIDENDKSFAIGELTGISANGFTKSPIVVDTTHANTSPGYLEKTWVYVTIQQLLEKADSLESGNEKDEAKQKALDLSTKYSLVTELTSLVVSKPNEPDSVINTEQVKPAAVTEEEQKKPDYDDETEKPPNSITRNPFKEPKEFHPEMQPGQSDYDEPFDKILPPKYIVTKEIILQKVNLSDVQWLQQFLPNSSLPTDIKVVIQGKPYNLDLSGIKDSFGPCTMENISGECHHFQFCPLNLFQNDVSEFFPFQCEIKDNYLGVCCPEHVS